MVGNHAVMGFACPVRIARRYVRRGFDQSAHQVSVVIVMFALQ